MPKKGCQRVTFFCVGKQGRKEKTQKKENAIQRILDDKTGGEQGGGSEGQSSFSLFPPNNPFYVNPHFFEQE